jgi:hypothetical protein
MKSISVMLLVIGLILLVVGYYENKQNCPVRKIEYRYIPRQFYEEQMNESNLKNLYSDMFDKASIWQKYPIGDIDISGGNKMNNFIDNYYNQ